MKTKNNTKYWELIAKYLTDECDEQETNELFNWIDEDDLNKQLFDSAINDLKMINLNKSMNKVNVDSAWDKLKGRIEEDEQTVPTLENKVIRTLHFSAILKYAAAIIILISIGFFSTKIYNNLNNPYYSVTELTAFNEVNKEVVLPDGSVVYLNADSKLQYPDEFSGDQRKVKLTGEGFFDVTKNPEKPFIIETDNAEIRVLGTSFNVNTNLAENKVEVFVKTGLVQLSRKNDGNEKILINPGNVGVLSKTGLKKSINQDENIIAWKTHEIIFREDKLADVIHMLNTVYKTNIICDNQQILNLKYTSTFREQGIDSVLNVICITFDLKIKYEDDKIYLIKYDS